MDLLWILFHRRGIANRGWVTKAKGLTQKRLSIDNIILLYHHRAAATGVAVGRGGDELNKRSICHRLSDHDAFMGPHLRTLAGSASSPRQSAGRRCRIGAEMRIGPQPSRRLEVVSSRDE